MLQFMKEIYVLFICEIKDDTLSLTSAHSFYVSKELAVKAKEFFNSLNDSLDLIYEVFKFPVQ